MTVSLEIKGKKLNTSNLTEGLEKTFSIAYEEMWKQLNNLILDEKKVEQVAEKIVPEPFDWKENVKKAAKAISGTRSPKASRMLEPRNDEEKEIMRALLTRKVLERIGLV